MLKKYSNEIVALLKTAPGFSEADFRRTRETAKDGDVFVLQFRDTEFVFKFWAAGSTAFRSQASEYRVSHRGGYPYNRKIQLGSPIGPEFKAVTRSLNRWLDRIKLYLADEEIVRQNAETPDLWDLSNVSELATTAAGASGLDAPFEQHERERVVESLQETLAKVRESQLLTSEQIKRLEATVDEVAAQAKSWTLSKREWLGLAIGGVLNVAVATAFSPDATRFIVVLLRETLNWMMTEGPKLLPQW